MTEWGTMTVVILKMSESSAPVVCNSIKHKWYISIVYKYILTVTVTAKI